MFGPDYQENYLVFCQPGGAYYNPGCVGNRASVLMKSAGLEGVSLHSLRHTHASELLSAGVPIPAVSKRLGHVNPNITMGIYIWNDSMADVIWSG